VSSIDAQEFWAERSVEATGEAARIGGWEEFIAATPRASTLGSATEFSVIVQRGDVTSLSTSQTAR